jgi:alkylmercury lyase
MGHNGIDLKRLAETVLTPCRPLSPQDQRLIGAAYRVLAEGAPASVEEIADAAGLSREAAVAFVGEMPGVARFDSKGQIVGFLGLSLTATPHRMVMNGVMLYTWCAWDSLFLPRVLGIDATVTSRCPITGTTIAMVVGADAIGDVSPPETMLSFLVACDARHATGVVAACCEHIHFLGSAAAGDRWLITHRVGAVLTLGDAMELARIFADNVLGGPAAPLRAADTPSLTSV